MSRVLGIVRDRFYACLIFLSLNRTNVWKKGLCEVCDNILGGGHTT